MGPSGADISTDDGHSWSSISGSGYHTFSFAPGRAFGWGAGSGGRIARLDLDPTPGPPEWPPGAPDFPPVLRSNSSELIFDSGSTSSQTPVTYHATDTVDDAALLGLVPGGLDAHRRRPVMLAPPVRALASLEPRANPPPMP